MIIVPVGLQNGGDFTEPDALPFVAAVPVGLQNGGDFTLSACQT